MSKPHKRPEKRPPLAELIRLRELKFPHLKKGDFAEQKLGITRLHLYSVEDGRRQPSLELAVRWVQLLAPEAKLSMFGPLPVVAERIRQAKLLAEVSPDYFQAA